MVRKVLFESPGSIHPSQYNLIDYPPEGYEFIIGSKTWSNFWGKILRSAMLHKAVRGSARVLPLSLTVPYFGGIVRGAQKADLIYSFNHLVFRKVPWVVFVEHVHFLVGFHVRVFWQFRKLVADTLASPYCKSILTWAEIVKKNVLYNLDSGGFDHKIEVVYPGVPKRDFVKPEDSDRVRILFVGSGRTPNIADFHHKGGKEVLKMFTILAEKYHNIELVMRAKIPIELKSTVTRYKNIKLIEETVPWKVLEQEFKSADILVHPTHDILNTAVLDAMSFGLPAVVTDIYNYPEWITDGITGFLIRHAEDVPYLWGYYFPPGPTPIGPVYVEKIKHLHLDVVRRLVGKVSILIEDESLRRRMGRAARQEVEEGKFSIQRRNARLKLIFDEALS